MLDKIQFLLSLQILGFCVFGGITLLLRARENRAKQILGWSMLLWAFLAAVRVSVKDVYKRQTIWNNCFSLYGTVISFVILPSCFDTSKNGTSKLNLS